MEKRCSECPEPRHAQSLCTFCNKWLCYQCTDMHQHQKAASQCPDLHPHPTRPTPAPQCPGPDLHQRGPSSQPPPDPGEPHPVPGSGSCPRPLLMCHSHRQEPLELFCESCDLLCCSSCHLSSHKNHRLVHVGKALQDQKWLFESLMAQVEERRAAVENSAKQIEDRLHSVKITQRKAENQIKMAKMIMMNELNKRANLLIEQLEKVSEDFQRRLEDQLQGAIEMCGQLDHVQNFVTWATAHHRRNPLLFSRELISLQMQRLLEPVHHPDAWVPVKIKFNWDASYWTKQMSSLGQLSVEGGGRAYSEGVACPSILRPQPITCMTLPPVFRSGRDQGCAYQACYQPQMCCLHCLPPQPPLQPEKPQRQASVYPARCAQSTLSSPPLVQRCWGPDSPPSVPPTSLQCPPLSATSPPSTADPPAQLSSRNVSPAPSPSMVPQSDSPQPLMEHPPDRRAQTQVQTQPKTQAPAEGTKEVQGEKASRGDLRTLPTVEDRELIVEDNQEESREQTAGLPGMGRDLGGQDTPERAPAGLQDPRPPLQPRDYRTHLERDGRRSTSLEMSVLMAHGSEANIQSRPGSIPSPSPSPSLRLVCGKRKIRSQSTPADLSGRSSTLSTDRPPGSTHGPPTSTADRARLSDQFGYKNFRPSRVSHGVISSIGKETGLGPPLSRGQPPLRLSPMTSYKTEPDNVYAYANEETGYEFKEKYRISRKSLDCRSEQEVQQDSGSPKVPVVCLERLKVLVSRLPPQGRRQSDPLPVSGMESSGTALAPRAWRESLAQGMSKGGPVRANLSLQTPPYTQKHIPSQSLTPPATTSAREAGISRPAHEHPSALPTHPEPSLPLCPSPDLDTDSDPRSVSEIEADSEPDAESDPQLESDPQPESSSEADQESVAGEEADGDSDGAGGSGPGGESEPVEMAEELDADEETDGDAESDLQQDPDPGLQSDPRPETDSEDMESDLPPDSQSSAECGPDLESQSSAECGPDLESQSSAECGPDLESQSSAECGPDLESDPESSTADPALLGSGPARKSPLCPGQKTQGSDPGSEGAGEAQPGADPEEMESEDFCAVCLIGGDLLCCDRCPKVFHLTCHVPSLLSFPTGDWMCTLCRDIQQPEVEYDSENQRLSVERTGKAGQQRGLRASDQRKCERLTLLIFSNILSAPFHEPVSPLARHYYQIIKRPMDLSVIRAKLNKGNSRHYYSPEEFVADVSLMFRNCAKFNYPDSEVAQAGRSLEAFFSSKLTEVYPDRAFPVAEDDSDSDEYDEVARSADGGFPWPERREQGHRKRKRRHSVNWRRHNF